MKLRIPVPTRNPAKRTQLGDGITERGAYDAPEICEVVSRKIPFVNIHVKLLLLRAVT